MPPKTRFDENSIVEAALEIAEDEGLSGITARKVAARLGSSVAPIYANFDRIDDLIDRVVTRVFEASTKELGRGDGVDPLADIGRASIAFARNHPALFRELALQPNRYMDSYEVMESQILRIMSQDDSTAHWTHEQKRKFLFKLRAFQLGLSAMMAVGLVPRWLSEEQIDEMLLEVGEDLLMAAESREGEDR